MLSSGFHRIRHLGLLANNGRKENIALARELLKVTPPVITAATAATLIDASTDLVRPNFVCTHCGAPMIAIETFARVTSIRGPPMVQGA